MGTLLRWIVRLVVAMVIATIPTRLSSHEVAVGFPFTWHVRQEVASLNNSIRCFSCTALIMDLAIVLLALTAIIAMFRRKDRVESRIMTGIATSFFLGQLVLTGCAKQSPLAGSWSTLEPFGDASGMATAETVFTHEGDVVKGTFKFKSLPDAARKELGAVSFQLEQISFKGGRLSFVVPIAPNQPKEWLLFNLQLEGNQLKGTAKENRPEVDKLIPVVFKRER